MKNFCFQSLKLSVFYFGFGESVIILKLRSPEDNVILSRRDVRMYNENRELLDLKTI